MAARNEGTEEAVQKVEEPKDEAENKSKNQDREEALRLTIRNHMLGTMGVCLIPAPAFDLAAITVIQLKMIRDLADAYDVSFNDQLGRSLLASLVGTLGAGHLALGSVGSLMKLVPGVGYLAAALTQPVLVGAATYATGKIFKLHFETGGTLLDFDIEQMREHFRKEYEAGLDVAKKAKK